MSGEYLGRASTRFPPTDFIKMSACELAFAGGFFYGNSAGDHLYQDTQ